ncbi:MAG: hypothetical protein GY711_00245 [bacterium]|nr:hypothetical protein [bacterium]
MKAIFLSLSFLAASNVAPAQGLGDLGKDLFGKAKNAVTTSVKKEVKGTLDDTWSKKIAVGDFKGALKELKKSDPKGHDKIWILLERGKVMQDKGSLPGSTERLIQADDAILEWERKAIVSMSGIAGGVKAALTDERGTDFWGRGHDLVLLNTAIAINYALMGDKELAAVYARRQLNRQLENEKDNERRIRQRLANREKLESRRSASDKDKEKGKAQGNVEGGGKKPHDLDALGKLNSGKHEDFLKHSEELNTWTNPDYEDFGIPYSYYVGAILLGAYDSVGEMRDMAKGAAGILPDNTFVQDLARADGLGKKVYVLFENGQAPRFSGESVSFPVSEKIGFVKIPYPRFKPVTDGRAAGFLVQAGETKVKAQIADRVDSIVATEFKSRIDGIWVRSVLAAATKAVANKQANDEIGTIGTVIGQVPMLTTEADTRTWRALPGEHWIAHVDAPADGELTLSTLNKKGKARATITVTVPTDGPSLVYVRSSAVKYIKARAQSLK